MSPIHRELAHAKLTRSLRVVGRRDDGMHLLEAEMVSIGLSDELEFTPSTRAAIEVVDVSGVVGVPDLAGGVPSDETNLVLRALRLVERSAAVRLRKRIPAGAGLGGGSADAAAALRFAGCFDVVLAATLGADVPFCLVGGRAAVSGIGEVIRPLPQLDLTFVVLSPPLSVSTPAVYRAFDARSGSGGTAPIGENGNDLEDAALTVEPGLVAYRDLFGGVAGVRPVLAGSGASWFVECDPHEADALGREVETAFRSSGAPVRVNVCSTASPTGS